MGKYLLRYLVFWLPAAIVVYFFASGLAASQIAQWMGAFFMIFGWSVNTGMCAYRYPRNTLALILAYLGINIIITTALARTHYSSALHRWLMELGGALSFKPLDIAVLALLEFSIPHELVVVCALVACCFIGWLCGVVFRRIRPYPYRPMMYG